MSLNKLWSSFTLCFSVYSVFPAGNRGMEKGSMEYVLCFLPLVGGVIGGAQWLWYRLAAGLPLSVLLYAAAAATLPALLSGGIHLDGLMDSGDAIGSHADPQRRLEILKDPHIGAFGVLACVVYHLAAVGLYAQLFEGGAAGALLLIFAVSRAATGLATLRWPSARGSGLQHLFAGGADKGVVTAVLVLELAALAALAAYLWGVWAALGATAVLGVFYLWLRRYTSRQFGGFTGDLAGFSICVTELILLLCAAVGPLMGGIFHG